MMYRPIAHVSGLLLTILVYICEAKVEQDPDTGEGVISFGTDFNDEYDYSMHMPDNLKCDACTAIAYQLTKKFKEAHKKRPSVKEFDESDIIDFTDEVCETKFEHYGIKHMDNEQRITGEGMEVEDMAGVTQGGGKHPARLHEMCLLYIGNLGEQEIYHEYHKGRSLYEFLCRGSGIRGYCSNIKKPYVPKGEL